MRREIQSISKFKEELKQKDEQIVGLQKDI
jgi:hypothetical protein